MTRDVLPLALELPRFLRQLLVAHALISEALLGECDGPRPRPARTGDATQDDWLGADPDEENGDVVCAASLERVRHQARADGFGRLAVCEVPTR